MVNCTAISSLYNETGIFSIFASAESASADEMVNVLCKELQVRHTLLGSDMRSLHGWLVVLSVQLIICHEQRQTSNRSERTE